MTTRALVLGGGGIVGIGWELGVLLGLRESGLELTSADRIVGTSAGSVVGATAGGGIPLELLLAVQAGPVIGQLSGQLAARDPSIGAAIDALWVGGVAEQSVRAEIGRLALAAAATAGSHEGPWVGAFERLLPVRSWPASLVTTAVAADDGGFRTFDPSSGVPLARAVAASCAIPGVFPPVTIDARPYMDGGLRSGTNADLAAGYAVVTILSPSRPDGPSRTLLEAEVAGLEAGGSKVHVVVPDDRCLAAMGEDLMDARRREAAAIAGRAQGRKAGLTIQAA